MKRLRALSFTAALCLLTALTAFATEEEAPTGQARASTPPPSGGSAAPS